MSEESGRELDGTMSSRMTDRSLSRSRKGITILSLTSLNAADHQEVQSCRRVTWRSYTSASTIRAEK